VISVRVSSRDKGLLEEEAERRGVPLSTAARMLMLEGLEARSPQARARVLLTTIEGDLDLRMALRRLVFSDPTK